MITLQIAGLDVVRAQLGSAAKQANFAASRALNTTAFAINDQLKNTQQIEHSRHRSPRNFMVNLLSGLIAYQLQPKKPCIHYTKKEQGLLTQPLLVA